MTLTLVDRNDIFHDDQKMKVELQCAQSPLRIDVVHNMSAPFYHTKGTDASKCSP